MIGVRICRRHILVDVELLILPYLERYIVFRRGLSDSYLFVCLLRAIVVCHPDSGDFGTTAIVPGEFCVLLKNASDNVIYHANSHLQT